MCFRLGRALLALAGCVVIAACGEPPTKEMNLAREAIAAARTAHADRYAAEELTAAEKALAKSTDAVTGKDFKAALNHALTSHERAQAAITLAGQNAQTLKTSVLSALERTTARLASERTAVAALKGRTPRKAGTTAAAKLDTVEKSLQETRALVDQGELSVAAERVKAAEAAIDEVLARLQPPKRPAAPVRAAAGGRR